MLSRFFGKSGLFAYSAIATIVSNIQVLKLTKYALFPHEVALGTVVFSTTFAVDNILVHHFGARTARKAVYLSFALFLFFSLVMKIAIMHPELPQNGCVNYSKELAAIFSHELPLFVSSVLAYLAGQFCDISVFTLLRKFSLSVKSLCSMSISGFVDNLTFSVFAWVVFADNPISWNELWNTYIINLYLLRWIVIVTCVPLVKMVQMIGVEGVRKF